MAAVEFAFVAPVMVFLFFATVEGSDALAASRRVTLAANTLADLVAQETEIETSAVDALFTGMDAILDQGAVTVDFRLVSVVFNDTTNKPEVHWSRDNSGTQPYAAGTEYTGPADVSTIDPSASLVVAEVNFSYTPVLSKVLFQSVMFRKSATKWPRRSPRVQLCTNGTCSS
ncbi:MAG: TadE/TadG family type IV pilus assembly protein [Pseudomonadota bacterium]